MIFTLFTLFESLGTIAFAISGAMVAVKKGVDLFGVLFLGLVTAFGGGLMRDITLGVVPPRMFLSSTNLLLALFSALGVFLLARLLQKRYLSNEAALEQINNIFDALGLGAFSVTGARAAMEAGFADNVTLLLFTGMITAIGGGILRDLLIREIPFVLKKRIYAVASLCGAFVYWLLGAGPAGEELAVFGGVAVTFLLRILATIFKWNLPKALPEDALRSILHT